MRQRLVVGGEQSMMASFAIGHAAGWLHVGGLRLTVERLQKSKSPRALAQVSLLFRMLVTLGLFYLFCRPCLPLALAGWWLARCWAVRRWS